MARVTVQDAVEKIGNRFEPLNYKPLPLLLKVVVNHKAGRPCICLKA